MTKVNFTNALKRFFPELESISVEAENVRSLIEEVESRYPGIKSYIVEDSGKLRKHVNIFIGENLIEDETNLSDTVASGDEVFIFQALSGG